MNTDQDAVHRLPREHLLRAMREARKEFGLSEDYVPSPHACSEDIVMMIEDLCEERGLVFDPETRKFSEAPAPEPESSDHEWGAGADDRVTLGEVLLDGHTGPGS